jgi:gamma-glutamyl-gamma-aminobutyrate hydrolase PuuD
MSNLCIGSIYEPNNWFTNRGEHRYKFVRTPRDVLGCDLLVFWGGKDWPTEWYGEEARWTREDKPVYRDFIERDIYFLARGKIPMVGVCRGGQGMVIFEGGRLWQDVSNHTSSHDVTFDDGDVVKCTSSHHQMFRLTDKMKLLGWSSKVLSPTKRNDKGEFTTSEREPEFALMPPDAMALAVQPHPEYEADVTRPLTQKTFQLIHKHLGIKL